MKYLALAALLAASSAQAMPTHVMVRAQSLDAKFIGTHTGGVHVILRDAKTGKVLADGATSGGTGDTTAIMKTPRARGVSIAEGDTAGFDAVVDIDQPTLVTVEATGPMGKPDSSIHVSTQVWLIPGRDITGDGLVLTVPGLVIEPKAEPQSDGTLKVSAKVTLMCGCPIEPNGVWDAANYTVQAYLLNGAATVSSSPLTYAGQASQFAGVVTGAKPGRYVLRVVATDAKTPNAGVVEQQVVLP